MEGAVIRYKNHNGNDDDAASIGAYESLCREKNIFDLDDLIFLTARIFETRRDWRRFFGNAAVMFLSTNSRILTPCSIE